MENEMQVEAFPRKVWNVMRVFFFMLRKGVSKRKLSLHLNLILKRSKIAGKSIGNIMFHHHSAATATATANLFNFYKAAEPGRRGEYEFSCSNTPAHHKFLFKRKQHQAHYEAQYETTEDEFMEIMGLNDVVEVSSPVLPSLNGFKPLRITDSPFPVFSGRVENGDCHVDDKADEFINKFFSQLRREALTEG